jgi:hypothetical protein
MPKISLRTNHYIRHAAYEDFPGTEFVYAVKAALREVQWSMRNRSEAREKTHAQAALSVPHHN